MPQTHRQVKLITPINLRRGLKRKLRNKNRLEKMSTVVHLLDGDPSKRTGIFLGLLKEKMSWRKSLSIISIKTTLSYQILGRLKP